MSKLTSQDIVKLARLARLKLTDEEISKFSDELSAILEYVQQLDQVKVDGLSPTYQVTGLTNVTRPDKIQSTATPSSELLKNVPATENGLIKVKRMIG